MIANALKSVQNVALPSHPEKLREKASIKRSANEYENPSSRWLWWSSAGAHLHILAITTLAFPPAW